MDLEPPLKRRRLSAEAIDLEGTQNARFFSEAEALSSEAKKEYEVGVCAFVNNSSHPLHALLKTRYTDFIVNEITPSGEVLHLKSTKYRRPGSEAQASTRNDGQILDDSPAINKSTSSTVADVEAETPQRDSPNFEESQDVSVEAREKLANYFDADIADRLISLYNSIKENPQKKSKDFPKLHTIFTTDRTLRGEIHQFIRTTFHSRIDSTTSNDGELILSAASASHAWSKRSNASQPNGNPKNRQGKLSWQDKGGEYVHFTLYKENKDTMEAIQWLCRQLKCNAKVFQFAGTKDRRAVTTQRCSAFRIDAERLANQNRSLRQSMIGDFEYHEQGLELGDLQGNEFTITLRECKLTKPDSVEPERNMAVIKQSLEESLRSLSVNGYLNYYGLQRFGTFTMRTDVTGRHILKTDFEAACNAILHIPDHLNSSSDAEDKINLDTVGRDDKARAAAIALFRVDPVANVRQALEMMPRKFNAESTVIRHLSRSPADFYGALMQIQRNLRLMYVHAYQSLVWNLAVTRRWELYGSKVVAGDLVLVSEHREQLTSEESYDSVASSGIEIDTDGEVIIQPANGDSAGRVDDIFERARCLTQAEADSGRYSVFDVVMPLPGYDVVYPANKSGTFYKDFMSSEEGGELDPDNMRRKQKDFSLSGSYRKILARIGEEWQVDVHDYATDEEQFVVTDAERLTMGETKKHLTTEKSGVVAEDGSAMSKKTAVVLRFQLGSSQYATMALRELSRGGVTGYKPEFSGGR